MIRDVPHCCVFSNVCVRGCTGNKIGDIGAQSIGDGLKSLTSLTTLNLSGECYIS